MGMDVYGLKPTAPKGEYFRNNVWWWRPLAEYIGFAAPDLHEKVGDDGGGWEVNDGEGLNAEDSLTLAKKLRSDLKSGKTKEYEQGYQRLLDELPQEECGICAGTGKREVPPTIGAGTHPCKACDTTGQQDNWRTNYPFAAANVEEFTEFLENCGGFKIN